MPSPSRPLLAATIGEPAGVGPLIYAQALRERLPADLVLIGDRGSLERQLGRKGPLVPSYDPARRQRVSMLDEPALQAPTRAVPGRPKPGHAPATLANLRRAGKLALQGKVDGVVTGPVAKNILATAAPGFSGQTEYFGRLARVPHTVMALLGPRLKLALATTHLPLAQVPRSLTRVRLERTLRITHRELRALLGLPKLRLLVCGLNPHAGEGGLLGTEEERVIKPVIAKLRRARLPVEGPFPADTVFLPKKLGPSDCVVAMYHDQALPVIKRDDFERTVNVTLGLPFIRVSVGHGTAYDQARRGRASCLSLRTAIATAARMHRNRRGG